MRLKVRNMVTPAIPISLILEILEDPKPAHVKHVLKSLYLCPETVTSASKADLNHFVSRTANLLNSREDYKRWFECHIVQIVSLNPVVITTSGVGFITALLKLVHHQTSVTTVVFQNAVLALNSIIISIRGKPVLTREILTPNLPNIISALLENLERDVVTVLPILKQLLVKNTTTFKPFVKKLETKLVKLLVENFHTLDSSLQEEVCQTYAYLNLIKPTQHQTQPGSAQPLPDDQWRLKILQLMDETRNVIMVYDNIIELSSERESMDLIKQLPSFEKNDHHIFPFLHIDLSQPITLVSISERIDVLLKLLTALITVPTPFPVRIPLGQLVQLGNLLMGISPNYISIKPELKKDHDLKQMILNDIIKTQIHGCNLVLNISKTYKKLVLPHFPSILSSLEVIVPIKNEKGKKGINIDTQCALNMESELLQVIQTVTELLHLVDSLTEFELVNKLVDVSILLLSKRTPLESLLQKQPVPTSIENNSQSQKNKKKKKSKDTTPLADILSHAELFELDPPKRTVQVIVSFFGVLIKKVSKLDANYKIKVIKYIIASAVKQQSINGTINALTVELLESLVLFPGVGEVYSVLPIVKRLLPNNEKLSLLTNPRFPILDVKYKPRAQETVEDDEDEEMDEIEVPVEETIVKDTFVEDLKIAKEVPKETPAVSVFKTEEQIQTMEFPSEDAQPTDEAKTRPLEEEDDTPSKRIKIQQSAQIAETEKHIEDESENDGSDFEIPLIDIDSDEE